MPQRLARIEATVIGGRWDGYKPKMRLDDSGVVIDLGPCHFRDGERTEVQVVEVWERK
jgi:hypothetical protein